MLQGQMRVANHLYAGARVQFLDINTSINRENPLFPDAEIPRPQFESRLVSLGPVVSYDSRDNSTNPIRGVFVQAAWLFGAEWLGSDFNGLALKRSDLDVFRPRPMGSPSGEPWHLECKSCRRVIGPNEATEQLNFERDEKHRLDEMNGTYHAECAPPYLSIKRALDALTRGFF